MITALLLHNASIFFTIFMTCLGTGLGGGIASVGAINALSIAPSIRKDIMRLIILSLAIIETGGIIGVIMALILLGQSTTVPTMLYIGIGEIGIALAIGISGFIVGLISALPARQAFLSLARQPFIGTNIMNLMLITLSIIQTPIIFGFIIALLIKTQLASLTDSANAIRMIVAGFTIGVGSLGPAIGLGRFAQAVLKAIGYNRAIYNKLLTFAFISQAIIETPIIFSLLVSLIILFTPITAFSSSTALIALIAAGLAMAIATASPGINSSRVAQTSAMTMAQHPEQAMEVNRISIIAQGLLDTTAIYGLVIALLLIIL